MQIKELLIGIPLLLFVFWIFAAPIPQDRIARTCEPIHWVGNLATSTTALSAEGHTATTARWSDKLNYSCQYMIWRLFYQDEYNKALKDGRVEAQPAQAVDGDGKPADTTGAPAPQATVAPTQKEAQPTPTKKETNK